MKVISLPVSLDYRSYDQIFQAAGELDGGPSLFDGHRLRWIDPNGMVNLLAAA